MACNVLQCIFQHVGNIAPNFGISQIFTIQFSNGLHNSDENVMSFHLICVSNSILRLERGGECVIVTGRTKTVISRLIYKLYRRL